MGDYIIELFQKNEKRKLETLFIPYALVSCDSKIETRQSINKTALIDYIITEKFKKYFVIDSILNSDHYGTIAILEEKMMKKQMPINKTFFDKKNYSKEKFQEYIRVQIGFLSGCHKMLTKWCLNCVSYSNKQQMCMQQWNLVLWGMINRKFFWIEMKSYLEKKFQIRKWSFLVNRLFSLNTEKNRWKFYSRS